MHKTLPVQQFYIRLERVVDEAAALEMWRQYALAHGWSRVGEPEVEFPRRGVGRHAAPFVIGKVIKTDEALTIRADFSGPLLLP